MAHIINDTFRQYQDQLQQQDTVIDELRKNQDKMASMMTSLVEYVHRLRSAKHPNDEPADEKPAEKEE